MIEQVFDSFDTGSKGYLDKQELSLLCQNSFMQDDEGEIDNLFKTIDSNQDGRIEKTEFVDKFVEVLGGESGRVSEDYGRTSTPKRTLPNVSPIRMEERRRSLLPQDAGWEDFTDSVGSSIYSLFRFVILTL